MHGGRSTGPRTAAGLARLRAARTVHGLYSAAAQAERRYDRALMAHGQVLAQASAVRRWLPAEYQARLLAGAPDLAPPCPTDFMAKTPSTVRPGIRRMAPRRRPADPLAAWKAAVATARRAKRSGKTPCTVTPPGLAAAASPRPPGSRAGAVPTPVARTGAKQAAKPHAP